MTQLIDLWPEGHALQEVMKTDAESAGEAVVLAVHQPMRFRKRRVGGAADEGEWVDEAELLEHFLADSPDGRVIVPIVGAPGSGKSHVVRWLNVHLRHRRDAVKRQIIRIPKGRSLKGVLEDLLAEVQGPEYERFRRELEQAQDRIEPERAAHALCEVLAQEVEVLARRATELELEGKRTETTRSARAFGDRQMLPTLLRDQRLRNEHFVDRLDGRPGVVRRLVAQLYEERVDAPVDDRDHVFLPEDLQFSDDIRRDELGRDVMRAMEKVEREDNPARAATVLNAALDVSKQQLLGLSPTVTELFLKIREQLLRDGMELVLLVEDFVVLSGLQGQLLQVMIQEAWRDGRQVRCTMRAVIAYTPGYLQTDTVLTRAGYEYRIPDEDESEAVTTRRIRKLVGAYLNASRIGQAGLTQALEAAGDDVSDRRWVPRAAEPEDDDLRRTMEAFGREDGIPLHPFTAEAIAALAEEACRKDRRLVYNPRFVINEILLRVLRHRAEFGTGAFPDSRFRSTTSPVYPESAFVEWVQRHVPRAAQQRYITFLSYWAFGKQSIAELGAVLRDVGSAFALPPPPGVAVIEEERPTEAPQRLAEASPAVAEPPRTTSPPVSPWSTRLDAWRKGQELRQAEWRTLRKEILGPALLDPIDWDWWACRRREIDRSWWEQIWIAGASSNPMSEAAAATVVATDEERRDTVRGARIAAELAALADARERGGTWDVDGYEADLARACSFVERHAPRVREYLFERPFGAKWSPLPRLVQGLAIGARLLSAPGGKAKTHGELVATLFAKVPDPNQSGSDEGDKWQLARQALAGIRRTVDGRPSWGDVLLEQVGARQGGSALVHAVDVARVRPHLVDLLSRWQLDLQDPPLSPSQRRNLAAQALVDPATIEALRRLDTALPHEVARVQKWLALMQQHLPADVDLSAFAKAFSGALDKLLASTAAGLSQPEARKLKTMLDDLIKVPVRAALNDASQVTVDASRADLLWRLGRVSSDVRSASERFIAYAEPIVAELERQLSEQAADTADPQAVAVGGLEAELTHLASALDEAKP